MQGNVVLVVVLNVCTLIWLLRSWFSIDHIIWKFHIIIWRKFRYFEMEWYPKIDSISGNFVFYILYSFEGYVHEILFKGGLPYFTQKWLSTTKFFKKSKVTGRKICSHDHHSTREVFKFMAGSLILQWNWSAFSVLSAGLTRAWPWIHTGYLLLKLIASIWSKNNVIFSWNVR